MTTEALLHFYEYAEYPIESQEYETYLTIYFAIKKLLEDEILISKDLFLLDNYLQGYSYREIANIMNLDRRYVSKRMQYILTELSKELDEQK